MPILRNVLGLLFLRFTHYIKALVNVIDCCTFVRAWSKLLYYWLCSHSTIGRRWIGLMLLVVAGSSLAATTARKMRRVVSVRCLKLSRWSQIRR